MEEGDFGEHLLDRHGFSDPYSLWEAMFADGELSITVINEIFSKYTFMISENIGMAHPLAKAIQAHQSEGLGFKCRMVDLAYPEYEELSLPSIDIVGEEGRLIPVLNINFEEFNNLLNGTPEVVAALMQFLYLNHRVITGQVTAYIDSNGNIDFDDQTTWDMNNTIAMTLICLGVDITNYSVHAHNPMSPAQRLYYRTLLDQARSVWDVPTDGPFVLN